MSNHYSPHTPVTPMKRFSQISKDQRFLSRMSPAQPGIRILDTPMNSRLVSSEASPLHVQGLSPVPYKNSCPDTPGGQASSHDDSGIGSSPADISPYARRSGIRHSHTAGMLSVAYVPTTPHPHKKLTGVGLRTESPSIKFSPTTYTPVLQYIEGRNFESPLAGKPRSGNHVTPPAPVYRPDSRLSDDFEFSGPANQCPDGLSSSDSVAPPRIVRPCRVIRPDYMREDFGTIVKNFGGEDGGKKKTKLVKPAKPAEKTLRQLLSDPNFSFDDPIYDLPPPETAHTRPESSLDGSNPHALKKIPSWVGSTISRYNESLIFGTPFKEPETSASHASTHNGGIRTCMCCTRKYSARKVANWYSGECIIFYAQVKLLRTELHTLIDSVSMRPEIGAVGLMLLMRAFVNSAGPLVAEFDRIITKFWLRWEHYLPRIRCSDPLQEYLARRGDNEFLHSLYLGPEEGFYCDITSSKDCCDLWYECAQGLNYFQEVLDAAGPQVANAFIKRLFRRFMELKVRMEKFVDPHARIIRVAGKKSAIERRGEQETGRREAAAVRVRVDEVEDLGFAMLTIR